MSKHTVTYENYNAGHPWYYFLGGPLLKPSLIRMSVETAGYEGYLQEDIEAAAKKNEPQRTTALREIKDKVMISFKRDLSRYRQLAHQLRQERKNNPDRCKENCCHQIDTGMSLKHNHLYNDFAHLLLLDSKLNAQPDLFENFCKGAGIMAKLSRIERKNHNQACELLKKDILTMEEKEFVLNNWHEGAEHMNGEVGAFFTPEGLALDFRIEVAGETIIDLCAGIGRLAFCAYHYPYNFDGQKRKIVCVEKNPAYIEVGQKILPEATWVQGDVTDGEFLKSLGSFDCAISNPPFGKVKGNKAEKYSGADFEYKVIEAASLIADYGVFIIPQSSAPFIYSGTNNHRFAWQTGEKGNFNKYRKFNKETGIRLDVGCGIDTTFCIEEWKGVAPVCEVVTADYEELRQKQQATISPIQVEKIKGHQLSLFDQLAA